MPLPRELARVWRPPPTSASLPPTHTGETMVTNIKRLVYFEEFMDPIAARTLDAHPEIELVRLEYASPVADNWAEMSRTLGYQTQSRVELREPWFANANMIAHCPNLLAVASTGAGYDMVDVDDCTKAGVIVVNQSGTNKEGVAEHALGLMLALSKKIAISDRAMRSVANLERRKYQGNDIKGKTLGIVGIGNIGTRLSDICRAAFGMTILAYDPYLTAQQVVARGGTQVGLRELMRQSDYVSVHCPRTTESYGMLGAAQFAAMKPSAYFINTARGGIHDEMALAEALRNGQLAGAGLDVFLQEPPPLDHPLLAMDNVIVSPHNAGMTDESILEMVTATAHQWIGLFGGRVPPRLVNPEAWPLYASRFTEIVGHAPDALS
jgi:D-3-phosphoglycerate dehydrogenase